MKSRKHRKGRGREEGGRQRERPLLALDDPEGGDELRGLFARDRERSASDRVQVPLERVTQRLQFAEILFDRLHTFVVTRW